MAVWPVQPSNPETGTTLGVTAFLTAPTGLMVENNRVHALELVKMRQNGLPGLRRRHLSQLHLLQPQFLQVLQPPSKTKGSPHCGQSMLSAVTFFSAFGRTGVFLTGVWPLATDAV